MLWLIAQGRKIFWKPSKPCHVNIYWNALSRVLSDEYPSARVSVVFKVFASFYIGQISHQQPKGQAVLKC